MRLLCVSHLILLITLTINAETPQERALRQDLLRERRAHSVTQGLLDTANREISCKKVVISNLRIRNEELQNEEDKNSGRPHAQSNSNAKRLQVELDKKGDEMDSMFAHIRTAAEDKKKLIEDHKRAIAVWNNKLTTCEADVRTAVAATAEEKKKLIKNCNIEITKCVDKFRIAEVQRIGAERELETLEDEKKEWNKRIEEMTKEVEAKTALAKVAGEAAAALTQEFHSRPFHHQLTADVAAVSINRFNLKDILASGQPSKIIFKKMPEPKREHSIKVFNGISSPLLEAKKNNADYKDLSSVTMFQRIIDQFWFTEAEHQPYILLDGSKLKSPSQVTFASFIDAIIYIGQTYSPEVRIIQHLRSMIDYLNGREIRDTAKAARLLEMAEKNEELMVLVLPWKLGVSGSVILEDLMIKAMGLNSLTNTVRGHNEHYIPLDTRPYVGTVVLQRAFDVFRLHNGLKAVHSN